MDWKARVKNPYFWVGIIGVILTAASIEPATLTSWGAVGAAFLGIVQNPFKLCTAAMAVMGVVVDPSTIGAADSAKKE